MRIHLIAVGTRMPDWVKAGYTTYASRLPRECSLQLIEIPPHKRGKQGDMGRILRQEGKDILAAIPQTTRTIALAAKGQQWSTEELAKQLDGWLRERRDLALLVGGPEGLDSVCLARAELVWSLSKLTFPHLLVRIVLAEQIYRAWSILRQHPYHRR
jgi:23S rRNA (pseudouridine1915-N3)-methyltransferase